MNSPPVSKKGYLLVWAGLMLLLFLTWALAEFNLGPANTLAAMLIAVTKMLLVMLFFMHVRYNSRLTWIFAGAGFVWFLIMILLTMNDYLTRGQVRPSNRTISYWQNGIPNTKPGAEPGSVNPEDIVR
jgi:cytochrome c oxidase subunit 4